MKIFALASGSAKRMVKDLPDIINLYRADEQDMRRPFSLIRDTIADARSCSGARARRRSRQTKTGT
jgi:hypothetical protein